MKIVIPAVMLALAMPGAAETPRRPAAGVGASDTRCAAGAAPGALTGLCPAQAEALLSSRSSVAPPAMEGCAWVVRETAFASNVLLYRTLRCGTSERRIAFRMGNHQSELVYVGADGRPESDADGHPLVLAQIYAGNPDGRSRALWEARDSIPDKRAAGRCMLKRPYRGGYPADALIVDTARTASAVQRDDAAPLCGPLGFHPMAESFDFWRTHQGYAWIIHLGTDTWDIDPASLTLLRKDASGHWTRAS